MAYSIQQIQNRSLSVNDLDLLVLLRLLFGEINENRSKYVLLQPYLETWDSCCTNYGPGTIGMNIDTFTEYPRSLLSQRASRILP